MQLLLFFIIVAVLSALFFFTVVVAFLLHSSCFCTKVRTGICDVPMFSTVPLLLVNQYRCYYFCSCTVALRAAILLYPPPVLGFIQVGGVRVEPLYQRVFRPEDQNCTVPVRHQVYQDRGNLWYIHIYTAQSVQPAERAIFSDCYVHCFLPI
jgi:hypothetical protein